MTEENPQEQAQESFEQDAPDQELASGSYLLTGLPESPVDAGHLNVAAMQFLDPVQPHLLAGQAIYRPHTPPQYKVSCDFIRRLSGMDEVGDAAILAAGAVRIKEMQAGVDELSRNGDPTYLLEKHLATLNSHLAVLYRVYSTLTGGDK